MFHTQHEQRERASSLCRTAAAAGSRQNLVGMCWYLRPFRVLTVTLPWRKYSANFPVCMEVHMRNPSRVDKGVSVSRNTTYTDIQTRAHL